MNVRAVSSGSLASPRPSGASYTQNVPFGHGSFNLTFQPGPPPSQALLESLERDTGSPEAARDAGRILSDYLATRPQLGDLYRELLPRLGDPWDTLGVVRYFELKLGDHLSQARDLFLERLDRQLAEGRPVEAHAIADRLLLHEGNRQPQEDFLRYHRLADQVDRNYGFLMARDLAHWREAGVPLSEAHQDFQAFQRALPPQLSQGAAWYFHDISDRPGQFGSGMHARTRKAILTGYAQAAREAAEACPGLEASELCQAIGSAAGSRDFALAVRLGAQGLHYAGEVYAWEQLSQWLADEAPDLVESFQHRGLPWLRAYGGGSSLKEAFGQACSVLRRIDSGELDRRALDLSVRELLGAGLGDRVAHRAALAEQELLSSAPEHAQELKDAFRRALTLGTPPAQAASLAREETLAAAGKIVRAADVVRVGTVVVPIRKP